MNWHIFASTFGLIFLAEMGDKTQLAAISMVAKTGDRVAVFLGAASALAVVTLIGVLGGTALLRVLPADLLHKLAASAFVVMGILMLWGKA
jgi:putative Ca2+/H+ antiporter (TMEM165/GDT1 family)